MPARNGLILHPVAASGESFQTGAGRGTERACGSLFSSSKEIGGHVSAQELLDVPSFNRNFVGYLGNLPGVVASVSLTTFGADSISVAGQNVRNVNYTMDGSNNNTCRPVHPPSKRAVRTSHTVFQFTLSASSTMA